MDFPKNFLVFPVKRGKAISLFKSKFSSEISSTPASKTWKTSTFSRLAKLKASGCGNRNENQGKMQTTYKELDKEIAERINAIFQKKNSFIEVLPGNFILPRKFMDIGESIRKLKVFNDDIWVVSYPRTGSTWAQEMVWLLGNRLDFDGAKKMLQVRSPIVELSALFSEDHREWVSAALGNTVETVSQMPRPRFARSHLPWILLPEEFESVKPKIIYTARNPKDLCVSFFHYCKLMHELNCTFDEFIELFLEGHGPIGSYWRHVLPFWKRSNDPNVLFLKYEDMNNDLPRIIRKCAKFLEVDYNLNDEDLERICEHLKFDKMQTNPAVNLEPLLGGAENGHTSDCKFIRKGKIGDWKNHMSPEVSLRFDKWTEDNCKGSGLTFEYE